MDPSKPLENLDLSEATASETLSGYVHQKGERLTTFQYKRVEIFWPFPLLKVSAITWPYLSVATKTKKKYSYRGWSRNFQTGQPRKIGHIWHMHWGLPPEKFTIPTLQLVHSDTILGIKADIFYWGHLIKKIRGTRAQHWGHFCPNLGHFGWNVGHFASDGAAMAPLAIPWISPYPTCRCQKIPAFQNSVGGVLD